MASVDVTRIASNIGASNALSALTNINKQLATHQTRLATGKRINSAGDDPAGYTIATKMLARSEGLKVSLGNISDAKNLLGMAETGLSKMNDILVQMRGKAEQAASDTLGVKERQAIQTQLSSYAEQIDSIVAETKWNNTKLLGGDVTKRFQTGADNGEYTDWTLTQSHNAVDLGIVQQGGQAQSAIATASAAGNVSESDKFTSMPELGDGEYSVRVLASASANDTGYAVQTNSVGGVTDVYANNAGAGNILANGANQISLSAYTINGAGTTGTVTYSYTNAAGAAVNNATAAIALTAGAGTATLGTTGVSFDVNANFTAFTGTDPNRVINLDYVQENMSKLQLEDSDGNIISVDSDSDATTTGSSFSFYVAAGATYDTGKGVSLVGAAVAGLAPDDLTTFDYKRQNDYYMNVSSADDAASYMDTVNNAIDLINSDMADLGSLVARMTFKEDQIQSSQINVESSYSRIMDANMAEEQVNASKFSILQQTATAMLAQANQAPQTLLSLFR
jgi:flagellin